jgi:hypothetical protein
MNTLGRSASHRQNKAPPEWGLDELEVVDELEIDGHPRILAVLRAGRLTAQSNRRLLAPADGPEQLLRSGFT